MLAPNSQSAAKAKPMSIYEQTMHYELKDFLVKGRKNEKTKEKLRINIRLLLNKHKGASIFVSNFSNSKLSFILEQDGFKAAFLMYKSSTLTSCTYFNTAFNDLYINELMPVEETSYCSKEEKEKTTYKVILAFRKIKKAF